MKSYKLLIIGSIFLLGCAHNSAKGINTHNKQQINQKLPKECGFGNLYYGKVEYRKASNSYYFIVKDRIQKGEVEEFELDAPRSPKLDGKYIILYGSQLVGGNRNVINGKALEIVYNNRVNFAKLKAWCALQPTSSDAPKAPSYQEFKYKGSK